MALGALCWLAGNLIWLAGSPPSVVVLWWASFLILTIAGERLELSRLLKPPRLAQNLFIGAVALLLAGVVINAFELTWFIGETVFAGARLAGLGMIALAAWLWRYDVARRTIRRPGEGRERGLTRYMGWCLLLGFFWLAVSGLLHVIYAGTLAGSAYDAILHSVFVGFVFSMIFAHAPVILPAVLGRAVPYTPLWYAPLVLLHVSLAARIAGDLAGLFALRQWGGMLNVVAILIFFPLVLRALLVGTQLARARS
jgi:hypothetical protein